MRKFFCGIGVFLFLCVISLGYYKAYQLSEHRRMLSSLEDTSSSQEGESFALSASKQSSSGYGEYYLQDLDGYVAVYYGDKKTLFEATTICTDTLPEPWKSGVQKGMYLKDRLTVYSFLENYSS